MTTAVSPGQEPDSWHLDWIAYAGGTDVGPRARVRLSRAEESVEAEGTGTGLIDAACHAVSQACGVGGRVMAFRAYSVGPGSEALGEVELDVEVGRRRVVVRASSTDVVEACARAFLSAVTGSH
ncbi:MAG TPA: alpha-isopropylmalate synthase regulatory domain-containing protein [Jiangellales bacterium]|nr:alpha-isopropylmalate synthase regulatory domain-containing protein [Jiangellales bacterium]